ncbi:MAG TPA: outer membrane protein assembly factor BamD [Longimicrobiales bacterium]|nr:outer membrane protein assembly factor BamD [Longimicrobiales bacterium]
MLALTLVALAACGPKQTPLSQLGPEELWLRGIEEYNDGEWDDAIRYFERFTSAGGADPRVHQARYYIAHANFNEERYVTAATEFARLSGDLGRAELADDARFMACRAYEELAPGPRLDQEYTRAAIDHCRALLEYFPDTDHAVAANAIIERMRNRLAEKVFLGGEWYYRRRAYDSAIVYFDDVAEQFPGTRWAPRALKRLVDIYDTLDYDEEGQEARERLLRDYPDSPEARALAPGS